MPEEGFSLTLYAFLIACGVTWFTSRWAKKRQQNTGQIFPMFWAGVGILLGLPLLVFMVTGSPLTWDYPVFAETGPLLKRGYQADAGMLVIPEMLAVWFALSVYTAAFIAEIVRAGIVAVPKGQTEASSALGIKRITPFVW